MTTDIQARFRALAERRVECASGLEHDYGTCAAGCKDGYVREFPGLWVECPCHSATIGHVCTGCYSHWPDSCQLDCVFCSGTGQVVASDNLEGRLFLVARQMGADEVTIFWGDDVTLASLMFLRPVRHYECDGENIADALSAAIETALEAAQPPEAE